MKLNRWIRDIYGNDGSRGNSLTHTKMSGGKYFIPEDKYDEFQKMYSHDFDIGIRTMTLSEIKSDHAFKMFFDIDMLETCEISNEYILRICKILQDIIKKYFRSSEDLTYVISTTQTKKVIKKNMEGVEIEYVKNGIHVNFPYLFVSTQMALQMRYSVILELEIRLGKRKIEINPWSDVIDCAPYSNGLKMCGSVKVVKCQECNGKGQINQNKEDLKEIKLYRRKYFKNEDDGHDYSNLFDLSPSECRDEKLSSLIREYNENTECNICEGTKRVLEERYYMPEYVINTEGDISESQTRLLKNSTLDSIKLTSIRCKSTELCTENYIKPDHIAIAPVNNRVEMSELSKRIQRMPHGSFSSELLESDLFKDDVIGLISWKGDHLEDTESINELQTVIRSMDPNYRDLTVKSVVEVVSVSTTKTSSFVNNSKLTKNVINSYNIRVIGDGSNYCMNKQDNHTTCTCYFSVTPKGVKQKCFSRKEIEYVHGLCSKYSSEPRTIEIELREKLFPGVREVIYTTKDIERMAKSNSSHRVSKKQKGSEWTNCIV